MIAASARSADSSTSVTSAPKADSDPSAEEQETRNKAAALMRAVQLAAAGL